MVGEVDNISFGVREGKLEGGVISGKSVDLSSEVIEHSNLVGEVNNLSFRVRQRNGKIVVINREGVELD